MAEGESAPDPVRVLISYAHGEEHEDSQVRRLWDLLRAEGIDARIDLTATNERRVWTEWMNAEIRSAHFVLVVASARYRALAEGEDVPGLGVPWESRQLQELLYGNADRWLSKIVPVVLPGRSRADIPDWLLPASATSYSIKELTPDGVDDLVRMLTDQPKYVAGPLGRVRTRPPLPTDHAAPPSPPPDLTARFAAATAREITELGPKYLGDLYFLDPTVDAQVTTFLDRPETCLLIVSGAGRGKTNLLCHVAEQQAPHRPVLFVSARAAAPENTGVLELVAMRLGYRADWDACFADLGLLAQRGAAPLVLLDAVNESPNPPPTMRQALHELLRHAHDAAVKVVITCRTDFWQYYRAPFWSAYVWQEELGAAAQQPGSPRGRELPLFPVAQFPAIAHRYFARFDVRGELRADAAERCRHPLVLRLFCEAYREREIGVVDNLRLYRLLKLFWQRKLTAVADVRGLKRSDAVAELVLAVARLMRERRSTIVPRSAVAAALRLGTSELDQSESLYARVLDEEIILEENVDEDVGISNIVFVYDRLAEYAVALGIYVDDGWDSAGADEVVANAETLMEQEYAFSTLRGALEFLVLRLEDRRRDDGVHLAVLRDMLARDWKWRRIGTVLAFQLDYSVPSAWEHLDNLARDGHDFVRRIVAENVGSLVGSDEGRALAVLTDLLGAANPVVRDAALGTARRLPAPAAIRWFEQVAGGAPALVSLAAEVLTSPLDVDSPVFEAKLRWLLSGAYRPFGHVLLPGLLRRFGDREDLAYGDLDDIEEFLRGCRSFGGAALPGGLDQLVDLCAAIQESLHSDLAALGAACDVLTAAAELLHSQGRPLDAEALSTRLRDLLPDESERLMFLSRIVSPSPLFGNRTLAEVAIAAGNEALSSAGARAFVPLGSYVSSLLRPWEIRRRVLELGDPPDVDWSSDDPAPARMALLATRAAAEFGLVLSPRDLRCTPSVGRLVLRLWQHADQRDRRQDTRSRALDTLAGLTPHEVAQIFADFRDENLDDVARANLGALLLALCRLHRDEPARIVDALEALIVWHEDRASDAVLREVESLLRVAPDLFWLLVDTLVVHPDRRVSVFAGRAVERVEYVAQAQANPDILRSLAWIIEEVAGIDEAEVLPDRRFVEDLDIDSLSAIEIVVQAEDQFGIRVPDGVLVELTTVGLAVAYVERHLPSGSARPA